MVAKCLKTSILKLAFKAVHRMARRHRKLLSGLTVLSDAMLGGRKTRFGSSQDSKKSLASPPATVLIELWPELWHLPDHILEMAGFLQ
jgi:hypothetical protein